MSSSRSAVYAAQYQATVDATVKAAEAVPEGLRFRQVADGKAHPLWLMGHLAMSLDMLTNNWMLGLEMDIPGKWGSTFGPSQFGGRAITNSPDDYPGWDEVVEAYKKAGAAAVAKVGTLTDEQLDGLAFGPMPDQFKESFGILDKSIPGNAAHDTYHRGQMALIGALG